MYKQAVLTLTESCNFRCPYCMQGTHPTYDRNMTDQLFKAILKKCYDNGITKITLFGGEPLVNFGEEKQKELLKYKNDFQVVIYTNGSLLDEKMITYFDQFPNVKVNISCHNKISIEGAKRTAEIMDTRKYALLCVCDHNGFTAKFKMLKPLLDEYKSILCLQTVVPDFDFSPKYTLPIYDALYPYKDQLQEKDLFTAEHREELEDGIVQNTEFIFTWDGFITLTKGVNVDDNTAIFPLETPFEEIIKHKSNPNNTPISHYPWQCKFCPIKNYKEANCPYAWGAVHDFSLCQRMMLLYAIIKGDRDMLCDKIVSTKPKAVDYFKYDNKIRNVMLNVTDQCNFRCRMCFCNWESNYMTKEIADKAIELAISRKDPLIDKITVTFFGGEPMLNYDLIQYVIEKYKDRCKFSMTTNASLLTPEKLDYLKENDCILLFSIDGDKETQDYNRPFANSDASTFDILKPKIPEILKRYPNITFRSTIIPETVKYLHHNYQFAKETGFNSYFCTPDAYSEWHGEAGDELMKQTSLIALDIIKDIYEGNNVVMPKFYVDGIVDYLRIKDNLTLPSTSPFRCGMGIYGFGVGATGIISACQEHSTITDGDDIFIIGDVWSGISKEKHLRLIDTFEAEKIEWLKEECKDCALREVCINHVCPSRQYFMFKTFAKCAYADCLWTRCSYNAAQLTFAFFTQNFSPNFEKLLGEILKNAQLELKKEVSYNV